MAIKEAGESDIGSEEIMLARCGVQLLNLTTDFEDVAFAFEESGKKVYSSSTRSNNALNAHARTRPHAHTHSNPSVSLTTRTRTYGGFGRGELMIGQLVSDRQ